MTLTFHSDAADTDHLWTTFQPSGVHTGTPVDGSAVEVWDDEGDGVSDVIVQYASTAPQSPIWRATTPLMRFPCLNFDGSSHVMHVYTQTGIARPLSDFITVGAYTLIIAFYPESITATAANEQGHALISDLNAVWGIYLRNASGQRKATLVNWTGSSYQSLEADIAENTSIVAMARHEAGNLYLSINGGAEVGPIASGNTADTNLRMALGYTGVAYYNGRIGEFKIWNTGNADGNLATEIAAMTSKWLTASVTNNSYWATGYWHPNLWADHYWAEVAAAIAVSSTRGSTWESLTAVSSTDLVPSWIPDGWAPDGWATTAEVLAHAIPWESSLIATLARTGATPWEGVFSALRALTSQVESKQGLSQVRLSLWETLVSQTQTRTLPYEATGTGLSVTRLSHWEAKISLIVPRVTPWDSTLSLLQTRVSPWASTLSLLQTRQTPWVAGVGMQSLRSTLWETQGVILAVAQTRLTPLESLTLVSSTDLIPAWMPDGWAPDGWVTLPEVIPHGLPWESSVLAVLTRTAVTPWEGVLSVLQARGSPVESLRGLTKTGVDLWEAVGVLASLRTGPWEQLVGLVATRLSPLESLLSRLTTHLTPYEATGLGLAATHTATWEARQLLSRLILAPWENVLSLTVPRLTPAESLLGLLSVKLSRYEATRGVSLARELLWEARGLTIVTRGSSWEALVPLLRTRVSLVESLRGVSDLTIEVWEARGIAVSARLAPWESTSFIPITPLFIIVVPDDAALEHTPTVSLSLVSVPAMDLAQLAPVRPHTVEVDEADLSHTPVVSMAAVEVPADDLEHTAEKRGVLV